MQTQVSSLSQAALVEKFSPDRNVRPDVMIELLSPFAELLQRLHLVQKSALLLHGWRHGRKG
jgi:hypothetical protein